MGPEGLRPSSKEFSDSDLEGVRDGSEESEEPKDPLTKPGPSEYLSKSEIEAIQGVPPEADESGDSETAPTTTSEE